MNDQVGAYSSFFESFQLMQNHVLIEFLQQASKTRQGELTLTNSDNQKLTISSITPLKSDAI